MPGRRHRPQLIGVAVDGDLRQLLSPMSYYYQSKPSTPSVLPRPYIPPTFRKPDEENATETPKGAAATMEKTEVDVFNSNIPESRLGGTQRIRPIELGSTKRSLKSLGSSRKVIPDRTGEEAAEREELLRQGVAQEQVAAATHWREHWARDHTSVEELIDIYSIISSVARFLKQQCDSRRQTRFRES